MIAQLNKEYIKTRPTKFFSRLVSYLFFEGRPLTTNGRWINPFLFLGYRIINFFPQLKKVKAPIFIIGTGRSGSTLLGMLLSLHKNVGFLNEPKALWHFAFDKEDVIGSYSTGDAKYKMDESHVDEKSALMIKKLYGSYLTSIFSNRLVDKYPELIFRIEFVKKIFPDAKFLFLQRNGFDTCSSTDEWIKKHRIEKNNVVEDWWGLNNRKWKLMLEQIVPASKMLHTNLEKIKTLDCQSDMAAVEWIAAMEEGLFYLKKYPEDILPVKYEELLQKPQFILSNIFSFCELEEDNNCIRYAKRILNSVSKKNTPPQIAPFLAENILALMKEMSY